jgi:hypothetical protein
LIIGTFAHLERTLASLTAEDLKDLGVTLVGHRRRLLDGVAALGIEARLRPSLPIATIGGSPHPKPASRNQGG